MSLIGNALSDLLGTVGGSVSGATASVSTQSLSALVAQKMAVSVEGRASLVAASDVLKDVFRKPGDQSYCRV